MTRIWHFNLKSFFIVLLILIAAVCVAGALYQFGSTWRDDRRYPPPGQLVDIGGYRLHLLCMGQGSPTVILDSGIGSGVLDWALVQPEIAPFAKVCSYDRAGYGWSDKGVSPRTSQTIVEELHKLLQESKIMPPYILVGHSFGGVNVRLYASTYPNEVAGIVLVDASHENQREKMPSYQKQTLQEKAWEYIQFLGAPLGLVRLLNQMETPPPIFQLLPKQIQDAYIAKISTTKHTQTGLNEWWNFSESLAELKQADRSLGNKPLIVIRAGKKPDRGLPEDVQTQDWQAWQDLQQDVAHRSTKGNLRVAEKSGHVIPWEQPTIIIQAVQEMVQELNR